LTGYLASKWPLPPYKGVFQSLLKDNLVDLIDVKVIDMLQMKVSRYLYCCCIVVLCSYMLLNSENDKSVLEWLK
jgi:hypothetical protein